MDLHLVTGYKGSAHVTSADQGAYNAATYGVGDHVFEVGKQFEIQVISNNTIRIYDGDIIMQGRHVSLKRNTYAELTIANGLQGLNRHDLIVARYTKDASTDVENVALAVIQGVSTDGEAADPECTTGDILEGGCLLHEMPLYSIPLSGLNVGTPVKLFDTCGDFLSHNHDGRYYTGTEVDEMLSEITENMTPDGIGLDKVDNTADKDKEVKYAESAGTAEKASHAEEADTATKAEQDINGNVIDETYEKIPVRTEKGVYLHLPDTLDGKAELKDLVHNLCDITEWKNNSAKSVEYLDGGVIKVTPVDSGTWSNGIYMNNIIGTSAVPTELYLKLCSMEGATITLSYEAKADSSRKLQNTRVFGRLCYQPFDLTTEWQKFSITVTIPTDGGYANTNETNFYSATGYDTTVPFYVRNIQFELDEVAHAYVPATGYVIKSCGKNMMTYPYKITTSVLPISVEFTDNKDGSFVLNGTSIGSTMVVLIDNLKLPVGNYILSDVNTYGVRVGYGDDNTFLSNIPTANGRFTVTEELANQNIKVAVSFGSGTNFANMLFKPMIRRTSETDDTWEKPISNTVTITNDTEKAYISTYDGVTNISNDYNTEMTVRYGVTENGNDLITDKGIIVDLTAKVAELQQVIADDIGTINDNYIELAEMVREINTAIPYTVTVDTETKNVDFTDR